MIDEEQDRCDALVFQNLEKHLSRIGYYIERSEDPNEHATRLDYMSNIHFDWSIYNYMDAANGSNVNRYPMSPDYYTSLRDIDVLLRSAVNNANAKTNASLEQWLSDLPLILNCELQYVGAVKDFREADYPNLRFSGHEYVIESIVNVKLYIVLVRDEVINSTKIYDHFFYWFNSADV